MISPISTNSRFAQPRQQAGGFDALPLVDAERWNVDRHAQFRVQPFHHWTEPGGQACGRGSERKRREEEGGKRGGQDPVQHHVLSGVGAAELHCVRHKRADFESVATSLLHVVCV
jgi:hypothetical protein